MASIFSKIVAGEIPCYKVAETEQFLAFLDIRPRTAGHTLVIPKAEVDYLFDLDESTYQEIWPFARRVAAALKQVVPCERISVAVIGLEVPHAHIHLVPINAIGDIDFSRPAAEVSSEEMMRLAQAIGAAMPTQS